MGLWPSKGLHLHGHEIKVSRADWRKEVDDPSKAQAFIRWCHFWWIVAPKNMIALEELPANWGLMEATESSLRIKRGAAPNTPEPITYAFLASLLRRQEDAEGLTKKLKASRDQGFRDGYEQGEKSSSGHYALVRAQNDLRRLKERVDQFERASGIKIGPWDAGDVGRAVAALRGLESNKIVGLQNMASNAVELIKAIKTLDLDSLRQQK